MENQLATLNTKNLPDLNQAEESVMSLSPEYMKVDVLKDGQVIRCFYLGVAFQDRADQETGELKSLEVATLAEQTPSGEIIVWESAASQLVSVLKRKEAEGVIIPNRSALKITYKGQVKGKKYKYSKFDIKPLNVAPVSEVA